jgi:arginase
MKKKIALILAGCGFGAPDRRTAFGPYETFMKLQSFFNGLDVAVFNTIYHLPSDEGLIARYDLENLALLHRQNLLALRHHQSVVAACIQQGYFPLILGGDHSLAMGTWSAVKASLDAAQNLGLVWIDAHMDANTPKTSPSQAPHGMPLAVLMGHGDKAFVSAFGSPPALEGQFTSLLGLRDYDEGEENFLERQGANLYRMELIKQKGFQFCFEEALQKASRGQNPFGISIDIDGFDAEEAPGTGCYTPNGLKVAEVIPCLKGLAHHPQCQALEIVEINLQKDIENKTLNAIQAIVEAAVAL